MFTKMLSVGSDSINHILLIYLKRRGGKKKKETRIRKILIEYTNGTIDRYKELQVSSNY